MINEFEFFHGAVLTKLTHLGKTSSIVLFPTKDNSSYILNGKIGIYIKYSTKRLSPWRFTFKKGHQDEIQVMREELNAVFILLVCSDDGIVCLSFEELKTVLDINHAEAEWIAVYRNKREKYAVKGSDGNLKLKIGVNDFSKIEKA